MYSFSIRPGLMRTSLICRMRIWSQNLWSYYWSCDDWCLNNLLWNNLRCLNNRLSNYSFLNNWWLWYNSLLGLLGNCFVSGNDLSFVLLSWYSLFGRLILNWLLRLLRLICCFLRLICRFDITWNSSKFSLHFLSS